MVAAGAIGGNQISSGGVGTENIADDAITGDQLADGAVTSATVNLAMRGWTLTSIFSATDYRVVAWTAGTFTASDGTAYSIDAGNTENMAALTFIYLDIATSTTVLQKTTTAATAVGDGKVLLAVAQNNSDITSKAMYQVFGGSGGNNILVDNIVANSASTNEFVSNTAQIANAIITNAKINDVSFSKAVGGTLTLGGSGNVSGVFTLKDAAGAEKIAMDNTGMTINTGKITLKDSAETTIVDATGLVSTANFANGVGAYTGTGNLSITSADGNYTAWTDMGNGLTQTFTLARTANVYIYHLGVYSFQGNSTAALNGETRIMVDSTQVGSIIQVYGGLSSGSYIQDRTYTLVHIQSMAAGEHTVHTEWRALGGSFQLMGTTWLSLAGGSAASEIGYIVLGK